MKNRSNLSVVLAILLLIAVGVAGWFAWQYYQPAADDPVDQSVEAGDETTPTTEHTSERGSPIVVNNPLPDSTITSPLSVEGTVPGSWSFEASFPIRLLDADRNELATIPATLNGDWMTDSQVPFSADLEFDEPSTGTGYLVLERANPSGLEDNADRLEIPIRFE